MKIKSETLKIDVRHWKVSIVVGFVSGLAGVLLWLSPVGVDFEKHVGLSWLFDQRGAIEAPAEVTVVAINGNASKALDLPSLPHDWTRSIHASLIEQLVKPGAGVIVFNVDFSRAKSPKDDSVFIGFSDLYDPGQPDRFYTVFTRDDGVVLSSVEIAATAFGNLLSNQSIKPVDVMQSVLIIFLFGFILGVGVFLKTAITAVPLALVSAGIYAAGVQHMFNTENIWLPLATPIIVQLPIALFIGLLTQYLFERKIQQRFSKAVSYYLPDNVAKELTEKEVDSDSLNKVVYGVCFANDMSGFSTISQGKSPEELAEFMNSYFDAMAQSLKHHNVDVTEFHADTIMCAWTCEKPDELDRSQPLLAALELLQTVEQFNASMGNININGRVGLEEGSFYLGHTGGGGRMGFSILGDCANTAARLESLNKHLGTHILASEAVAANANNLLLRSLGKFVLKGQAAPVPVVEVMGIKDDVEEALKQLNTSFSEALNVFHQQNWPVACEKFENILKNFPEDGPAKFYLTRSQTNLKESAQYEDPTLVHMDEK